MKLRNVVNQSPADVALWWACYNGLLSKQTQHWNIVRSFIYFSTTRFVRNMYKRKMNVQC